MTAFLHSGDFIHRAVVFEQLGLCLNSILRLSPSKDLTLSKSPIYFSDTISRETACKWFLQLNDVRLSKSSWIYSWSSSFNIYANKAG